MPGVIDDCWLPLFTRLLPENKNALSLVEPCLLAGQFIPPLDLLTADRRGKAGFCQPACSVWCALAPDLLKVGIQQADPSILPD